MVALNTAYAPSETRTQPKNRVGNFFGGVAVRVGENRPATRNRIGEKRPTLTIIASGRPVWPSRDPIGEAGGFNLYGMVDNDPINYFDPFGLNPLYKFGYDCAKTVISDVLLKKAKGYLKCAKLCNQMQLEVINSSNACGSNSFEPNGFPNLVKDKSSLLKSLLSCFTKKAKKMGKKKIVDNLPDDIPPNLKEKLIDEIDNALSGAISVSMSDPKPSVDWSCAGNGQVSADLSISYSITVGSNTYPINDLVNTCKCAGKVVSQACCKGSCSSK